ncbi:MAG TPA: GNAT family N-acetyltransferase [Candidatus Eisenbacteria bacterium]
MATTLQSFGSERAVPEGRLYRLRDRAPVLLRPIRPEDKGRLMEGFERLSPESRYQRFMAAVAGLSESQLRRFTEIDYADHMAWIALDPSTPDQPAVGVARYIRLPGQPAVAEVAVTVLDDYQGRGLGTLLLGLVSRSAAQQGIATFRAYALETNSAMIRILRDLGAAVRREDTGVLRLDVPVPRDVGSLPDSPTGRAFQAIARSSWAVDEPIGGRTP